ncbi:hypothetical protein FRB96_002824 [Tulasnella sp. 330]|nr:hypothetical protein FRB96_002824 [Tulasnella sp. 330]
MLAPFSLAAYIILETRCTTPNRAISLPQSQDDGLPRTSLKVSNLANASALVYHALRSFPAFGDGDRAVNWCGFYLEASVFLASSSKPNAMAATSRAPVLNLGPFNGKPACLFIQCIPGKSVCADAFLTSETLVVSDVESYPGHIACDGETKSELVVPMVLQSNGERKVLGVMDLDCLALRGFDENDKMGLEKIAKLLIDGCDW